MSDFEKDREQFPDATSAHWKLLLREINLKRAGHISRRKLAKMSTKDFVGLDLKKDKSIITFGKYCHFQVGVAAASRLRLLM